MEPGILTTLYSAAVIFLYYFTAGFTKKPLLYRVLKVLPVVILAFYSYGHSQKINLQRQRFNKDTLLTIYLIAYIVGDLLLSGDTARQLANAAFVYSVGHIFYMLTFLDRIILINKYWAATIAIITCIFTWNTIIRGFTIDSYATLILCIYTAILSTCLIMSSSLYFNGSRRERPKRFDNGLRFFGFLLFYMSSSLIIVNMLHQMKYMQRIILSTYFMAQYLLFWCVYAPYSSFPLLTSNANGPSQRSTAEAVHSDS